MTQDFDLCIGTQDPRGRPVEEVLCIVGGRVQDLFGLRRFEVGAWSTHRALKLDSWVFASLGARNPKAKTQNLQSLSGRYICRRNRPRCLPPSQIRCLRLRNEVLGFFGLGGL